MTLSERIIDAAKKLWRKIVLGIKAGIGGVLDVVTVIGGGDTEGEIFPILNFGLREEIRTGAMEAGSNILQLTTTSQFVVGEKVIVEIGGEAGQGLIGTVGVGGSSPITDASQYYRAQISPLSLKATVTELINVNGSRLRLDEVASVTTSNARVYFDCTDIINGKLAETHAEPYTLTFPAGEFAIRTVIFHNFQPGWTIQGAGIDETVFMSPKGTDCASFTTFEASRCTLSDFTLRGNWRRNGFGFKGPETNDEGGVPQGILMFIVEDGIIERVKCVDISMKGGWFGFGTDCIVRDCITVLNEPHLVYYAPWFYGCSDSVDCTTENCRVESAWLIPGFEAFRSSGAIFTGCVGINATFSSNSSGGFHLEDCFITIQEGSQFSVDSFSHLNPIYNINSNIQPPDASMVLGGEIINCGFTVEGAINPDTGNFLTGININDLNPNITIDGGTYTYPDGAGEEIYPRVVNSTGENTHVLNVTCVGDVLFPDFQANIQLAHLNPGVVTNCIGSVRVNGLLGYAVALGHSTVTGVSG